jgi:hypothetical protein
LSRKATSRSARSRNKQYRLDAEGHTFDGQGRLRACCRLAPKQQSFGSRPRRPGRPPSFPVTQPQWARRRWWARVVYVDVFGNLITMCRCAT